MGLCFLSINCNLSSILQPVQFAKSWSMDCLKFLWLFIGFCVPSRGLSMEFPPDCAPGFSDSGFAICYKFTNSANNFAQALFQECLDLESDTNLVPVEFLNFLPKNKIRLVRANAKVRHLRILTFSQFCNFIYSQK